MTSPSGGFQSPGYPEPFYRTVDCFWTIHVNQGSKIRFLFSDLDIPGETEYCYNGYVEVTTDN